MTCIIFLKLYIDKKSGVHISKLNLKYIFVHGGPGLNSTPELNILKPHFDSKRLDVLFWNEPKDAKSYSDIVYDLATHYADPSFQYCLIGHSFGARYVIDSLLKTKENVTSTFFINSALDMINADEKIVEISQHILKESNPDLYSQLIELLPKLNRDKFDENKGNALLLAFKSAYFVDNFIDLPTFQNYFSYLSGENEFRIPDHVRIRKTSQYLAVGRQQLEEIPNTTLVGDSDPVFNLNNEEAMVRGYFPNSKVSLIKDQSHAIHIESMELFFRELISVSTRS
jgi:pimeloyl-ACP methyl ester carboxylesterase